MAVIINGNGTPDADKITVTASDLTVNDGLGDDEITLTSGSRNVIHGDDGADTIVAESGAGTGNKLYGDGGNDTVSAKESIQSVAVYGGDGSDKLYGGKGDDYFNVYTSYSYGIEPLQ